jgi:hypothetical protein
LSEDARSYAPATARNRDAILAVLRETLPESGLVLEIASGTGEHICHFAAALPNLVFQPSDPDASSRESIAAWTRFEGLPSVLPPLALDVEADDWADQVERPDAILNVNMIHISPWTACQGLMRGAGRLLAPDALLYLYGPYKRGGRHTAPSNEAFDHSLRQRDVRFGVRDLEDVLDSAAEHGLELERTLEMPANNLSVVLRAGRSL